jgi:arginine deiminase
LTEPYIALRVDSFTTAEEHYGNLILQSMEGSSWRVNSCIELTSPSVNCFGRKIKQMKYGSASMVKPIKSVLVKHPKDAFLNQQSVVNSWPQLGWMRQLGPPNFEEALSEYERFVDLLRRQVSDVRYLPPDNRTGIDSLYVHDPVVITEQGAILLSMGNVARRKEPEAAQDYMKELGIPIFGAIEGEGKLEGGDLLWLNEQTLAIGRGYRTNDEGIRQLEKILGDSIDRFIVVPLPHWQGEEECLHLLSLISLVDDDLAVIYSKLLPVPFREELLRDGLKLIEVPDDEYGTLACNILALSPRKCIMLEGNPKTRRMLENEGVEISDFKGQEICIKGEGGPTCLTRPILRE